jgi:predicted phosphodiesterase
VLVFGGPLGNLDALSALLTEAKRLGVPAANMICTGDVAAYGAQPEECSKALLTAGIATVMGNCEEALATGAADCGCGFVPGSACEGLAENWYPYAKAHIGEEVRTWMAALPRRLHFHFGGSRFAVIHGGARRINRYLYASDGDALQEEINALNADAVIAGHGGLPFTQRFGSAVWNNPGALGLPANDGTPRVWYSLITTERNSTSFTHHALDYDHGAQAHRMRAAGLPEAYANTIETGLWPDTEILPAPEKTMAGKPLAFNPVVWESLRAPST